MTKPKICIQSCSWQQNKQRLMPIRQQVFIEEQKVPKNLEWDGLDENCYHVLATVDGSSCGTARMLDNGHIGRMAVLPDYRNIGIGSLLLKELLTIAKSNGLVQVYLYAQTSAIAFYIKHGFHCVGDEFMDAGIPHKEMHLSL